MKTRRFRFYAEKEDLQTVFQEYQSKLKIYYVPAYSDTGEISYGSIMDMENLGVNFRGSHNGNMQMFIFPEEIECLWKAYQYNGENKQYKTRYSTLMAENTACILIDFNGIYQENTIFPTEISTVHYDDSTSKMLYDELKKIVRKQSAKTVNGAYICPKAYEHREKYRFCTMDMKSPPEHDLKVE
ncbi:MAG: hypothetical protein NC121_06605 [Blautia sp.]|nr:hypothetical protein [Blautia sp.]